MSDFSSYHQLGAQQEQERRQGQQGYPPPNQPNAYYSQHSSPQSQQHTPWPSQGGFTPQASPPQLQGPYEPQGGMAGLTQQMGAANLGPGEPQAPSRAGKRRDRHAYHNLEQTPGTSQAYNGMPPPGQSTPSLADPAQQPHPYGQQPITSAMSQFPAPSGAPAFGGAPQPGTTIDAGTSGGGHGRVDPEQIPSVARARDAAAHYYRDRAYLSMEQHLPPPAAVPFAAVDQGPSAPRFARLTLNGVPASAEQLAATALPLGLVLRPLAPLAPGEAPVPVLDFGASGVGRGGGGSGGGPPRCARCRAYVNPFMAFAAGGSRFVCNMCAFPSEVPPDYFAPTDLSGVRVDRDQRPELRVGTVEFMVPKEYWAKEPVPLRHLFVIDVSQEAVNRGFLEAVCDGIRGALYGDGEGEAEEDGEANGEAAAQKRAIPPGAKVGFVTFDKDVHFYNCHVSVLPLFEPHPRRGPIVDRNRRPASTNRRCSSCPTSRSPSCRSAATASSSTPTRRAPPSTPCSRSCRGSSPTSRTRSRRCCRR